MKVSWAASLMPRVRGFPHGALKGALVGGEAALRSYCDRPMEA